MEDKHKQVLREIVDELEQIKERLLDVAHKYDESTDEGKQEADTLERCYLDLSVAADDLQYLARD